MTDYDPYGVANSDDVKSAGEKDQLTKSRKWREAKGKKYTKRFAGGAEMLENMKN